MSARAALRRVGVTNLVALVACAGLGAFYLVDRGKASSSERDERRSLLLPALRESRVTELRVRHGDERFRLSRKAPGAEGEGARWEIDRGAAGREAADEAACDKYLSALAYAAPLRAVPGEGEGRAGFGLEASRFAVEVAMGGEATTLTLGGPAAQPEGASFVDVDGKVVVVRRETTAALDLGSEAFRARDLLPYASNELSSMRLEGAGGERPLVIDAPGGRWRFAPSTEGGMRASRAAFERLVAALAGARADRFLTDAEADGAQAGAPTVTLTMTPRAADRPAAVVRVGGDCPGLPDDTVVVRTAPSRRSACAGKGLFAALSSPAGEWVDRRPFYARADEVERLEVEGEAGPVELERKGSGWHERAPVDAERTSPEVAPLLAALTKTDDATLLPPGISPPPGLASPRATVKLHLTGEAGPAADEAIVVGRIAQDGTLALRRSFDGAVLVLPAARARAFVPGAATLRSNVVTDVSPASVRAVRVWVSGAPEQSLARGPDGVWKFSTPRGVGVDVASVEALVGALGRVRAGRWVGADDGSDGLTKPRARAEFDVEGDAGLETVALSFGDPTEGGYFAARKGEPSVFVAPAGLLATVSTWAFDRDVFAADPARVTRVRVGHAGRSFVFVTHDGRFEPAPGSPAVEPAKAQAAAEALREMRADDARHPGPPRPGDGLDKPALDVIVERVGGDLRYSIAAPDPAHEGEAIGARRQGIDAVYTLPAARVASLLALFE